MTYQRATQYLESFINYEKIPAYPYKESLKLERIKDFLDIIGNPQNSLKCLHVAGTKGKGSTCAFLTYILREAGYRVGLYTSPHLSDFRERIRILYRLPSASGTRCPIGFVDGVRLVSHQVQNEFEGMISKRKLTALVERLKPTIEKYNKSSKYGPLSFFEVYTALAFAYFKENKVDFAILETGLGGRLDATNVCSPYVCAITPISYEHTQKLGNTLKEIAGEKAGIIKSQKSKVKSQKLIVISAPQKSEAMQVIRDRCREVGASLCEVDEGRGTKDERRGTRDEGRLRIKLIGEHQQVNARVAVAAIKALRAYDINVSIDSIKKGLYNTLWPGRCEVIAKNPLVVLDGAQNVASAQVLKQAIKSNFCYKKLILVLGISSDKDILGICQELRSLADEIILTRADNPRATKPEILAKYFSGKKAYITQNVKEAKRLAVCLAKKKDLILVTGSLFVVGEFRC